MEPVEAEVPITAEVPERNQPVEVGLVETPGQRLIGGEERLSARIAFSGYHLHTLGQDFLSRPGDDEGIVRLEGEDLDIELLRARATMAYQRIAESEFGAHLDLEYRPRINGTRLTDQRLNELYVSYGMTDFRRGTSDLSWGVSAGRLAIREAGFAQADGLAFRARLIPELHVGAFAGITGNPYGYNWSQRSTEIFSADWWTGGAFGALRWDRLSVNLATVVTFANLLVERQDLPTEEGPGLDRIYVHLDASYLVLPELNVFLSGFVDALPTGQVVQNLELVGSWTPAFLPDLDLTLGVGRFSTVVYELSTGYTFVADPNGNVFDDGNQQRTIVDQDGNPVIPFDGALFTAAYNLIRFRAGYDVLRGLNVYARVNTRIRDVSATNEAAQQLFNAQLNFAPVRLTPGLGARYGDPDILDARAEFRYILDDQSNADAVVLGSVGRGLFGLYLSVDGRYYVGQINAADGGVNLSYTLPRDWMPGMLMVRGSFRYFRENVTVLQPDVTTLDRIEQQAGQLYPINAQESFMGFAGIEWRM